MKRYVFEFIPLLLVVTLWRLVLAHIEVLAPSLFELREQFLGPSSWANLDGVHYLSIAQIGYRQYEQAFFPLYPLLIKEASLLFGLPLVHSALGISYVSSAIGILFFYLLSREFLTKSQSLWAIILFLAYPLSFFFIAVYPSSLFLCLATVCLYTARKKKWLLAVILGFFASSTRLFGVFLFPVLFIEYYRNVTHRALKDYFLLLAAPGGLVVYMFYLWKSVGDPLAFFHSQPAFGAGRSGDTLILLPQVLWRYVRIFLTASTQTFSYQIALLEVAVFFFGLLLVMYGRKTSIPKSYLLYSAFVLTIPTFTGTLSSIPRYMLSAFPLFFVAGAMHNTWVKWCLLILFLLGLIYFTSAFLQGYFVS